jgi:DNA-directed RNA polymerase specialized sigma24 family protein
MAAVHGMTAREIADIEGIPLGTARSRIRAGMTQLQSLLPANLDDHE